MGNFYTDVIMQDPRFQSEARIYDPNLLYPVMAAKVEAVKSDAAHCGVTLVTFETYRAEQRQESLFLQQATKLKTVGVHHYGLACDFVKIINGELSWKGDWSFMAEITKEHGLIWGGNWNRPYDPRGFHDLDHVQFCSVTMEKKLFAGEFYPDENYNPYFT